MIAKSAWRDRIATLASHNRARVTDEHPPTRVTNLRDREPEYIAIERRGSFEVRNGNNESRVEDHGWKRPSLD